VLYLQNCELDFFVCIFYGTTVTIINDSHCFPKCPMLKIYFATFGGRVQDAYGVEDRDFCANAIITQLVRGDPIPMGDFKKTQIFIINIENKYELAKGRGKLVEFGIKYMYTQVLSRKLAHMQKEWQREIRNKSYSFRDFTKFVRTGREQEEIVVNSGRDEGKPEKVTAQRNEAAINPFDARHRDTASNDQNPVRPRSDTGNQQGCQMCKGEHHMEKCSQFIRKNLFERVKVCKERWTCFKCLSNKSHKWTSCDSDIPCTVCDSRNHHRLLHEITMVMVMRINNNNNNSNNNNNGNNNNNNNSDNNNNNNGSSQATDNNS
jgi:hypothetical protein